MYNMYESVNVCLPINNRNNDFKPTVRVLLYFWIASIDNWQTCNRLC